MTAPDLLPPAAPDGAPHEPASGAPLGAWDAARAAEPRGGRPGSGVVAPDDELPLPPGVRLRAAWAAARARNARRRTRLVVTVGGLVGLATLAALAFARGEAQREVQRAAPRPGEKPDTLRVAGDARAAHRALAVADSTLAARRDGLLRARAAEAAVRARAAAEAAAAAGRASQGALLAEAAELDRLLERAQTAPLPTSYRALAAAPALQGDPRVRLLIDSLDAVEREREAFGTVGGVDPLYVALTNRVTGLGRSIEAIAARRRDALRAELAATTLAVGTPPGAGGAAPAAVPPASPPGAGAPATGAPATGAPPGAPAPAPGVAVSSGVPTGALPGAPPVGPDSLAAALPRPAAGPRPVDTLALVERRDAARRLVTALDGTLAVARARHQAIDRRWAAARARADVELPPLAAPLAALALGAAAGLLAALLGELRRPRLADAREAERVARTRVLAVVRPGDETPDRARRAGDGAALPLVDPANAGWRTLYLSLAAVGASVPIVSVTGEEPALVAAAAANLAALAAEDGRGTLVLDADVSRAATSRIFGLAGRLGLADAARARLPLAEAVVPVAMGRNATVDVIPAGTGAAPLAGARDAGPERDGAPADPHASLRDELARLAARYDFVVVALAPTERGPEGALRGALLAPDAVVCAHAGHTPLPALTREIARLRGRGAAVRGIVVWEGELEEVR